MATSNTLSTFNSFASAMSYRRGFCVPRCVVLLNKKQRRQFADAFGGAYAVTSPSTAKRLCLRVVYPA